MASWTRDWRPAGWGRTPSRVASTRRAQAAMAFGNPLVSGEAAPGGISSGISREVLDMVPHILPAPGRPAPRPAHKPGCHRPACSLETGGFTTGISVGFWQHFVGSPAPAPGVAVTQAVVGVAPPIRNGENDYVAAPKYAFVRPMPGGVGRGRPNTREDPFWSRIRDRYASHSC